MCNLCISLNDFTLGTWNSPNAKRKESADNSICGGTGLSFYWLRRITEPIIRLGEIVELFTNWRHFCVNIYIPQGQMTMNINVELHSSLHLLYTRWHELFRPQWRVRHRSIQIQQHDLQLSIQTPPWNCEERVAQYKPKAHKMFCFDFLYCCSRLWLGKCLYCCGSMRLEKRLLSYSATCNNFKLW